MIIRFFGIIILIFAISFGFLRSTSSHFQVDRAFSAPIEKVWRTWNDPELMKQWWGPKDFTAPEIKNEFVVGGTFLYSMRSAKGETYWNTGKFVEITPLQKIVTKMSFADASGKVIPGLEVPVPGVWPDSIDLIVEFKTEGDMTHVYVTEIGIPLLMKIMAKMGWQQQFDKFERVLASTP